MFKKRKLLLFSFLLFIAPIFYVYGKSDTNIVSIEHFSAETFFWIAIILISAKVFSLIEKIGQPSILGELIVGIIFGNLYYWGIDFFEPIKENSAIHFLAQLGIVILLFQVGLEFNFKEIKKTGFRASLVAIVAVISSFVLGAFIVGPWLLPGIGMNSYLFLGATLTATSIGITARAFKDIGKLHSPESKIVLEAAAIDDILGLIILTAISSIVTMGVVSATAVSLIAGKAIFLLVVAIFIGSFLAPYIGRFFSKINTGVGMKFTFVITFGLFFSFIADKVGLAPVVGAFAAGIILDPVHFRYFKKPKIIDEIKGIIKHVEESQPQESSEKHLREDLINDVCSPYERRHIGDIIEPLGHFLVPIFFVTVGMSVDITSLFNAPLLLIALGVTVAAIAGKLVAGFVAGKVNKWAVGWAMVVRGEVALIFATTGKSLGVVPDDLFSVIIVMVIVTILVPPMVLTWIMKRSA